MLRVSAFQLQLFRSSIPRKAPKSTPGFNLDGMKIATKSIAELRTELDALAGKRFKHFMAAKRSLELDTQLCIRLSATGRSKDAEEALERGAMMWDRVISSKQQRKLIDAASIWTVRTTLCAVMNRCANSLGREEDVALWKRRMSDSRNVLNDKGDDSSASTFLDELFEQDSSEQILKRAKASDHEAMGGDDDDDDGDPLSMAANARAKAGRPKTEEEELDDRHAQGALDVVSLMEADAKSPMEKFQMSYIREHPVISRYTRKDLGPRYT